MGTNRFSAPVFWKFWGYFTTKKSVFRAFLKHFDGFHSIDHKAKARLRDRDFTEWYPWILCDGWKKNLWILDPYEISQTWYNVIAKVLLQSLQLCGLIEYEFPCSFKRSTNPDFMNLAKCHVFTAAKRSERFGVFSRTLQQINWIYLFRVQMH